MELGRCLVWHFDCHLANGTCIRTIVRLRGRFRHINNYYHALLGQWADDPTGVITWRGAGPETFAWGLIPASWKKDGTSG